jgi:hypothetical protein
MRRLRHLPKIGLVALLAAALGATFAGPAGAYTKAQKAKIRHRLMREVKKNPRVVLKKRFFTLASHVDFELPLTIRLNPCIAQSAGTCTTFLTSNDTLNLDLGPTVGVKPVKLSGRILAKARFLDPFEGEGSPGQLALSIPPYGAGNAGGAVPTAQLRTTPVQVLTNPDVNSAAPPLGCSPSPFAGADPDNQANNPAGINANTVFRTGFLPVGVGGVASGGQAFLFGNPSGGPDVTVTLNTQIPINSIIRAVNTGDPSLDCRQTWSGAILNNVTARAAGTLRISPAFTLDGKLRLAKLDLTGPTIHNEIQACLDPFELYATAAQSPPSDACGAFPNPLGAPPSNPSSIPLNADATVVSITGEALVGDIGDTLPPTPNSGAGPGNL